MSAPIDCPICMDCIESTDKNYVTTECGHCFHTNCLMKSVAHNGFGCPYCRTVMAEEPQEDEVSEWEDEEEQEEQEDQEDVMRGFRLFWNNINGEPHDNDDEAAEEEFEEELEELASHNQSQDTNVPSTNFVAEKLREQGVTFDQLVKLICYIEHDEYEDDETAERLSDELFGKFRIIISNYTPELAIPTLHPEPLPREPLTREPLAPTLPREPLAPTLPREPLAPTLPREPLAQPKTPLRSESHSGFMITM